MKRKKAKQNEKDWLDRNAVKILCRYCDLYETCDRREAKEKIEAEGIITRCVLCPNNNKKYKSWEKINSNGEVINISKVGIPIDKWYNGEDKKNRNRR